MAKPNLFNLLPRYVIAQGHEHKAAIIRQRKPDLSGLQHYKVY